MQRIAWKTYINTLHVVQPMDQLLKNKFINRISGVGLTWLGCKGCLLSIFC